MNRGCASFTDLLFSFCSQPVAAEGVPDPALLEEGEGDDECGGGGDYGVNDSPYSSSASQVHEATEDFLNVPDCDNTNSYQEPPSESQRTPMPWPQRIRLGKIPDRRASLSGRKSALEKAMRNFADKKSGIVVKPEISQEFDSLDEAYDFYNLYSWETGFGIKYGQCRRNVDKCKIVQDIVCGCAGKPRRENSHSVCCQCPALIRLHRTSDHGWFIHDMKYQGKPRRENSHSVCCQCPALMRLHRTSDHGWFIHDMKYEVAAGIVYEQLC
ncbi:uncharacterized protein LOC119329377 [Triticum dicoccoides]|uniref:uncharacterized protein LOC119329377 n=1 Tax=Triticum dicoccoides TaxID=85692 RepID=UPI001891E8F1|nr:uncharacterized protein LOC119329377 [Triticum dicoccoides]XP_044425780.1 uncharacterized protein LOC123150049 [Triticum aestivum]